MFQIRSFTPVDPFSLRLSPASSILWVELTSHHSLLLQTSAALAPSAGEISPGKNNNLPSYRCQIYSHSSVQLWDFSVFCRLVRRTSLLSGFCSSAQSFAACFLQTPPRGGRPCSWLTLPTAGCVVDFHHQVIAHAGRTKRKPLSSCDQRGLSKVVHALV